MKSLITKLVAIQTKLKAPKNQKNKFGNYNYRSCEDILESVKPLLNAEGLVVTLTDKINNEPLYCEATATITDGDESLSVTAQAGINTQKKGMDVAQTYGASSSYARKYALNGLFLIDDTKDADATNDHGQASVNAKQWLNKGSGPYHNALDYIKAGGKVSSIKKKYSMNKDVETELNELVAKHHG